MRYGNVEVSQHFVPLLGDVKKMNEDKQARTGVFYDIIVNAQKKGNTVDFKLIQFGADSQLMFCSIRAFNEFEKLVGSKIDRQSHIGRPVGYMMPRGFAFKPTDSNFFKRKKQVITLLELNKCSQYLPMINRICDEHIDQIDTSKEVDIMNMLKNMSIEVILDIVFGED